jgi:uncharacterized protein
MDMWFFVAAFLAEVVGTLAGFGSSIILLPIALLFFDFKTALVLVAFMHLFGNLGRITFFRKGLVWRVLIYFGVIGIAGTLLGALLVSHIDQSLLKALLGMFLIIYASLVLLKPSLKMRPTKINMLGGGAASGFLAGLVGTGGAVRSAFLTAYNLPKAQYIGTAAAIAIAVDGARIPLYLNNGLLAVSYYWMLPILFVLAFAGSYAGKRLVAKIPRGVFSKVILVCLLLAGAKLVVDHFLA